MGDTEEYGILVHEFAKNATTKICVHVQEFKGTTFLSVREFYEDDVTSEWKPTKKGITIRPELYAELLHGVVAAADALGVDVPDGMLD